MKIKLDKFKIDYELSEELTDMFYQFIVGAIKETAFAGKDEQDFDIQNLEIDIKIDIETEDEYQNQNGMTDRNVNEFIRLDDDSYINDLEKDNAFFDEDYCNDGCGPYNDFSDDDIDDRD